MAACFQFVGGERLGTERSRVPRAHSMMRGTEKLADVHECFAAHGGFSKGKEVSL